MLIGQCANSYTDSYDMLKEVKKAGADFIEVRGFTIEGYEIAKVKEIKDQLIELNMPALLILDFGGISFMDSSGIGLVMGRYRILSKSGAELHITGASESIYKVMRLAGIERLASLEKNF